MQNSDFQICEFLQFIAVAVTGVALLIALIVSVILFILGKYYEGRDSHIYFEDDARAEELF